MMLIDTVLFDLDGVLIDSSQANCEFYGEILFKLGYGKPSYDECEAVYHLPMTEALRVLSREQSSSKIERILKTGKAFKFPVHLMSVPERARYAVDTLASNYLLGIVTNGSRAAVEDFHHVFGRRSQFAVSVAFEDVEHPKPNPEPILRALQMLGVSPETAIYIGDSASDVTAAHRAGTLAAIVGCRDSFDAEIHVRSLASLPQALAWI
jgi:pyrophosphatase PpaX